MLDAYRREILTDNELGLGNTIHINAYRVAGLIPGGALALFSDDSSMGNRLFTDRTLYAGGHIYDALFSKRTAALHRSIVINLSIWYFGYP